ncbi:MULTISPECIES: HK97 family phage prohead protease [Pacificibacter]|uniref:HK97 family phage prohead protease n=1 Tax=Pacificibacter TaxID=1042323 RepID=UPI001C08E352|nr:MULTISPECIES: HK97 family phage prohead protease [Pacificibacter]MBU2935642.1 HK97 family phage prohead protease [Pacificibacter marinus]MDO6614138.1 HK97 family phage prohead protease [Pacificibacter sp. 1_MG-2023]
MYKQNDSGLEHKFMRLGDEIKVTDGVEIEGYASLFGRRDQGGDIVQEGAYRKSLAALKVKGRSVKMLWQHDPAQPIGIWDEVREDARGLYVKGRLLTDVDKGREAVALIQAGAIDGLSIGYRTVRAQKLRDQTDGKAARLLSELELWEVSLVTFPMLPEARLVTEEKGSDPFDAETMMRELADALTGARKQLARI